MAVCGCGRDGVLYFHSRCHPHSATWSRYHKDGFIEVICATCSQTIAQVGVASSDATLEPSVDSAARLLAERVRTAPPLFLARLKRALSDFNAKTFQWKDAQ